jgi:hypothetical protein
MDNMELEARDYLSCLKPDFDIDAQLASIRALLRQHLGANRAFDEEIARLGEPPKSHQKTLQKKRLGANYLPRHEVRNDKIAALFLQFAATTAIRCGELRTYSARTNNIRPNPQ